MKRSLTLALAVFTTTSMNAQSVVLSDDFNDSSLNTGVWETILPFGSSSVTESEDKVRMTARGTLATVADMGTSYTIEGAFSMTSSLEHFKVIARSDTSTVGVSGERTGIVVAFTNDGDNISIQQVNSDGTIDLLDQAAVSLSENTTYSFSVTVDSDSVSATLDGNELVTSTTSYGTGERVLFMSREFSGTSTDLFNVTFTKPMLSYGPASKDNDYVSEFREYLDGTNPETDSSVNALSQDLLFHFSGDKDVPELSGYFHDLSLIGNGIYTEDRFENINSSFTVVTYDDYIEGTAPDLVGKSFTISCWVKKLYTSGQGSWLFRIGSASANGKAITLAFDYGGTIRFSFFYQDLDATTPLDPFEWYHVAASYDANNNERKVYLNGSLIASDFSGNTFTGDTYFRIGNPNLEVDDFRVYGRVLSAQQITDLGNISNPDSDGDRLTDYYEEVGKTSGLRIIPWIDGRTNIEITPSGLRYYHIQADAPGIPTVLDLATVVNNDFWTPSWPGSGARTNLNDYSNTYSFAESKEFIKSGGYSFSKTGRSSITVAQEPSAENGNTLILAADDLGVPGGAWHTIHVIPAGDSVLSSSNKDSDGDGFNDGTETVFGGNPFRATAKPPFQAWATGGETLTLSFPTELGVTYDLESKLTLSVLESWSPLQSAIVGDGEPFEVTVPYLQSNEFFRFVEVVD